MTQSNKCFNTQAIHYGYSPLDYQGALVPPVFKRPLLHFPRLNMVLIVLLGKKKGIFILVYLTLHWIY